MEYKKVLLKKEIRELAEIKTTKKWARQIKKRNIALLKVLRSFEPHLKEIREGTYDKEDYIQIDIGCPHCQAVGCCENCSWFISRLDGRHLEFCTNQKFGGVSFVGLIHYVKYDEDYAAINMEDPRKTNAKIQRGRYDRSETFLLGHIQWADMIISGEMKYTPPK